MAKQDFSQMASQIIQLVGGVDNINTAQHCITRLRFTLKDESKADDEKVKEVPGVMGLMKSGGQYQVIVGGTVNKVFDEVAKQLPESKVNPDLVEADDLESKMEAAKNKNREKLINKVSRYLMKMMFPLIPSMAAVAILKGLMMLLVLAGLVDPEGGTYMIMTGISDAFFYYIPILVGVSTAKAFGSNPYIGATIGASLLLPATMQAHADGTALTLFGIPVILTAYNNSIFPTMIATIIGAKLEKWLSKKVPSYIDFLTILIVLGLMVPATYLVIGPVFTVVSEVLASGMMGIFNFSPILTSILFGGLWQVMVMFGMHYAFIPILTDITVRLGANSFSPILGLGVWALCGTALGFALKCKKEGSRAKGFSAFASGLFGVTEPIIFGIALPYRKPFICAMIAGALAGPVDIMFNVTQYANASVGGVLTFPTYMNPNGDPTSLIGWFASFAVSFGLAAILTYITTDSQA
jgi:PTS system beta-glucosides-specific IIC component